MEDLTVVERAALRRCVLVAVLLASGQELSIGQLAKILRCDRTSVRLDLDAISDVLPVTQRDESHPTGHVSFYSLSATAVPPFVGVPSLADGGNGRAVH